MNNANTTSYELNAAETRLDGCCPGDYPHWRRTPARRVNEEKGFYIPEIVTDEGYRNNPRFFSAAFGHAKDLGKARRLLDEALDLVRLTLAEHRDDGNEHATATETVYKLIEKRLCKAANRLQKHDRRHTNLFLAYFDLKGKTDAAAK